MQGEWPAEIGTDDLVAAVAAGWRLSITELHHLQIGGGGHHWRATGADGEWFVTVDDLDTKDWFGTDPAAVLRGLTGALHCCRVLHQELDFVVAPVSTADGAALRPFGDRYAVSVYPYLHGTAGVFGPHPDPTVRRGVLDMLARLHTSAAPPGTPQHHRPVIGRRTALARFLRRPDEPWSGGPFSEEARQAFAARKAELLARLDDFDRDVERRASRARAVVTHGEPHGGNVMTVDRRLRLIDWDTVGLAPPERDLWFAVEDDADAQHYAEATGHVPDPLLLDLYRRRWRWDDLASAVDHLGGAHRDDPSSRRYLAALPELLSDVLG